MSKKYKILMFLANILIIPTIVLAEDDKSYGIMTNVLNAILNAFSWFGYAVALGILIWIGIKYMLSGANERANLKGTVSMYLIGVALIVLCSTIAGGVAKMANHNGENTAEGIVDEGFRLAGIIIGSKGPTGDPVKDMEDRLGRELTDVEKMILKDYEETNVLTDQTRELLEKLGREEGVVPPTKEEKEDNWVEEIDKLGNTYYVPEGVVATYTNNAGKDPTVSVPKESPDGKTFKHWIVIKKYGKGNNKGIQADRYIETDREIVLKGSDSASDNGLYDYEIYAVYQ